MFGIPELDTIVCLQLSRQDLAQCVRVSKDWHRVASPYLWSNLTGLQKKTQQQAFCRLVLDDYLQKHRCQQEQDNTDGTDQSTHGPLLLLLPSPSMSTLQKFGPWIRELPDPLLLLQYLKPPYDPTWVQQAEAEHITKPGAFDLLCRVYKCCPGIQVPYLRLSAEDLQNDDQLRMMAEVVVPHVRYLHLSASSSGGGYMPWELRYILLRSNKLEKLGFSMTALSNKRGKTEKVDRQGEEEDRTPWPGLQELNLDWCADWTYTRRFWPWLWQRCHHVEKLSVRDADRTVLQSLAEGMLAHMPNLRQICLGHEYNKARDLKDETVAALLSGSCNGWKVVSVKSTVIFEETALRALEKHFATLESFDCTGSRGFPSSHLVQTLSSSPNLSSLIAFHRTDIQSQGLLLFGASRFVDLDPITGLFKPWLCETSLRTLKVMITHIPRPDLGKDGTVKEKYQGEGRDIQRQVYGRLARLVNLETLSLGHDPNATSTAQYNCLEMSLDSGLDELEGLKTLKNLNVSGMRTRIAVAEVEWMAAQWPDLMIYGLVKAKKS